MSFEGGRGAEGVKIIVRERDCHAKRHPSEHSRVKSHCSAPINLIPAVYAARCAGARARRAFFFLASRRVVFPKTFARSFPFRPVIYFRFEIRPWSNRYTPHLASQRYLALPLRLISSGFHFSKKQQRNLRATSEI